jgi:hypothetical protein
MRNKINLLTYMQLSALSDSALVKCVRLALGQLDEAVKQGESTIEQAQIHQFYENELAKRNYVHRFH